MAGITLSWGTPQTYFDNAGLASSGTQLAARITLSNDAEGTWSFGAIELGTPQAKFIGNPIAAGHMSYVPLQGDVTHDGFVGIEDLNNILGHWNLTVDPGGEYDPSGDGFTGIEDLNILLGNWNAGTPRRPILATPNPWGDLDGDGFVGFTDPKQFNGYWGLEVTPGDLADPSGDGFVGIEDLNAVLGNWNAGTPPGAGNQIPEPGILALFVIVLGTLTPRRIMN